MNNVTQKDVDYFKEWLRLQGAIILKNVRKRELVRFELAGHQYALFLDQEAKIYWNKVTLECAYHFWEAFRTKKPIPYKKHKNKCKIKHRKQYISELILRDGEKCFYCNKELIYKIKHIEHLLPRAQGGLNILGNLVLACSNCINQTAKLDFMEKLKFRDKNLYNKES